MSVRLSDLDSQCRHNWHGILEKELKKLGGACESGPYTVLIVAPSENVSAARHLGESLVPVHIRLQVVSREHTE